MIIEKAEKARRKVIRFCNSKARHKARYKRAMTRWLKRFDKACTKLMSI